MCHLGLSGEFAGKTIASSVDGEIFWIVVSFEDLFIDVRIAIMSRSLSLNTIV